MVARSSGGDPEGARVSLPDRSLLQCGAQCVIYTRRFHRPSGLSSSAAVLLDCGLLSLAHQATLNGALLQKPVGGSALDITSLLQPYNELQIELHCDQFTEASSASASLQIIDRL
jgi:hypothetical protein